MKTWRLPLSFVAALFSLWLFFGRETGDFVPEPPAPVAASVALRAEVPPASASEETIVSAGAVHVAADAAAFAACAWGAMPWTETVWADFKHQDILEARMDGRVYHAVANHLLVTFADKTVSSAPLWSWAAESGDRRVEDLGGVHLLRWSGAAGADAFVRHLNDLHGALGPSVHVEPDLIVRSAAEPNDPLYPSQHHLPAIHAPEGWAVRREAPAVVVAVLDSGIARDHPDLVERVRPRPGEIPDTGQDDDGNGFVDDVYGWNFVDDTNDTFDFDGHGTMMAGIIGAHGNNAIGVTGVAWDVTLMPVSILDGLGRGTTSDEIRAINYILGSEVHIVNASYGGPGLIEASRSRHAALRDAGVWLVAAAGNESADIDRYPVYPAAHGFENIIAVAAADKERHPAEFSNKGLKIVDLHAPGTGIWTTTNTGGYAARSGTSQAAAVVSGALALVLAEYPQAERGEIRSRIIDRARHAAALSGKSVSGAMLDLGHAMAPGEGRTPHITVQPESVEMQYGEVLTLTTETVSRAGTETFWTFNGEPIPGAGSPTLTLGPLTEADEGDYQLHVRDVFGEASSAVATVTLEKEPPVLLRNSTSATIVTGQRVELFAEVDGSPPQTLQWLRDGVPVPGATGPRLVFPAADASLAGEYILRVTSPWGSAETDPIPVTLDPVLELSWNRMASFPPSEIRRSGPYFFGDPADQLVFGADLVEWRPVNWPAGVARGPDALAYGMGAYWFVDLAGRLRRSTDLETWEIWVELPDNPGRSWSSWGLSAGGGRMIVRGAGQGYFLIDPVARTAVEHADPGTFPSEQTTSPSAIHYVDGAFYFSPSRSSAGFRSGDGVNWTRRDVDAVLPLHVDDLTGSSIGRNRENRLHVRAPGGDWQFFLPFGEWVSVNDSSPLRTFSGGFQVGSILHDFRNGHSWTVNLPGFAAPGGAVTHYYDHEASLTALEEAGVRTFRVEDSSAGGTRVVVPPLVDAGALPGNPPMIESGGRVFLYAQPHLYELLPSGERVWRDERSGLAYRGTANGEAFFRKFDPGDGRLFRIDGNGRFALVQTAPALSPSLFVDGAGEGLYALGWEDGVFWTSLDGRAWQLETGIPGRAPHEAALRDGVWIAPRFAVDDPSGRWMVEIFRRPVDSSAWEPVFSRLLSTRVEEGNPSFALFSAPRGFLVRVDEAVYFSADGLHWSSLLDRFTSIAETGEPRDGVFLVRGELADSGAGQTRWYGSRNGIDWFATDPAIYPLARGAAVAFREVSGRLEVARLSEGDYRAGPVLSVDGARLLREVPAVVEVEASIPDAAHAVSVELMRVDAVVGTINPAHARFPITLSRPGVETYRVRVLYDDGWTTTSGDLRLVGILPLKVREGRVFPAAGFEPPTFYVVSNERIFALRAMTGEVFTSTDGFDWIPLVGAPSDFMPSRSGYTTPDGTFVAAASGAPDSAYLGWLLHPGADSLTHLPKPTGTQGRLGDVFLLEGKIHALMGNGMLYRLDGPGGEWAFVREPAGFPPSNSPVGPDIRVYERAGWYLVTAHGGSHLTRDFRQLTPVAIPGGWSHHDGFVFMREDRRAYALLNASLETLRVLVETETPLTGFQDLGNGTYIATSGGVRNVVLPDGRLLPLDLPAGTFRHEGTTLLVLSGNGDVRSVEANDFSVDSVTVTEAAPGAEPSLGARVRIGNGGLLGMGSGVSVNLRAWLESADDPGAVVALGDREIDASGLVPGAARGYSLRWDLPADLPLGDYRLRVEVNADGRSDEINTDNNVMRSAVFAYNPEISLLVDPSRHGAVVADQIKASMPFGTLLTVEAQPSEGFRFLGWNGTLNPEARVAGIEMTQRRILHAHFVPVRLYDAFPALAPLGTTGWYEADGDYLYPETLDWTYSADHGWLFTSGTEGSGTWFWAPAAGWLWKPAGLPAYYDASARAWLWREAE